MAPVALTILDLSGPGEKKSLWQRVTTLVRNPVGIGSLSGVAVSASGLTVPGPVLDPLTRLSTMFAVPVLAVVAALLGECGVAG